MQTRETELSNATRPKDAGIIPTGSDPTPGPKFFVDVEGTVQPWDKPTITTEEIIKLGGWDPSQGAIEIDEDNVEHTLQPGQVIELKPGHGFAKKVKFKRG